ncbi:7428_t:CDS:10 [Funneliformis geosporum]|uniref:7428_t:CDS:1 n=1 Tax=Funneliformis geosporum TaxID=1117311 RepID=A0A9W4SNM0_9GLOM|nr:7428_t:CDS:10 [Funneliformis geosporum]
MAEMKYLPDLTSERSLRRNNSTIIRDAIVPVSEFPKAGEDYDLGLAISILQGLRERTIPDAPEDYVIIYTGCWDNEPDNRPSMSQTSSRSFEGQLVPYSTYVVRKSLTTLRKGTSYSCVGVWQNDSVEIIANDQDNRTTPSYVVFTETEWLFGNAARNQVGMNPYIFIFNAKRFISHRYDEWNVQSDMKASFAFKVVDKTYFNNAQSQAIGNASEIASLNVPRIINEATLAAIAYGEGTLDISILNIQGGILEVKAVAGYKHLGSEDFNHRYNETYLKNTLISRIDKKQVHEIFLEGAYTRIPKIQNMISEFFNGKELNKFFIPGEVIAYGAAVQAGILSAEKTKVLMLLNVAALSLSIETAGGVMKPLIKRNTTLTWHTFDINQNSILNVSAVDIITGRSNKITVTEETFRLSERIRTYVKRFHENNEKVAKSIKHEIHWKIMHIIATRNLPDFEFPSESNDSYVCFLNSVLKDDRVVQGLKDKRCFPNSYTSSLKKISDLFDPNNFVFLTVFGGNGNTDVFLHSSLLEHVSRLSSIGFNHIVNETLFTKCAKKIEDLQNEQPPSDIRYRGFTLVDHLYKNIKSFNLENISRFLIFPITESLDEPYKPHYNKKHVQVFGSLNMIILLKYKVVAWSKILLIAEDVIPPSHILQIHQSFGIWNGWADKFQHDVFEIYKWLDEETVNEGIDLSYIQNERLFLNFNIDQNPFNNDNWVSANNLVLNRERGDDQYVNPRLAMYPNMLKSAGVKEIKPPNFEIKVRRHDQSSINRTRAFDFLLDQTSP